MKFTLGQPRHLVFVTFRGHEQVSLGKFFGMLEFIICNRDFFEALQRIQNKLHGFKSINRIHAGIGSGHARIHK